MKVIRLKKIKDCIMSEWFCENELPDGEMIKLFGTHCIPTAFTSEYPLEKAKERIQLLNPNDVVVI